MQEGEHEQALKGKLFSFPFSKKVILNILYERIFVSKHD